MPKELESVYLDAGRVQPLHMSLKAPNVQSRSVPKRRVGDQWFSAEVPRKHRSEIQSRRSVRSWSPMRSRQPKNLSPNQGILWNWRPAKRDRHAREVEDSNVYKALRFGRGVQLSERGLEFDDTCAHMPRTSTTNQRHRWRSQLWRSARRVRLPPNWRFRDLWGALCALFLTVLMFARREGRFDAVEELLADSPT